MIYGFLKYYKLYILLLPYFIFWVGYVSYFVFFTYCLLWVRHYTFYFPEDTEWFLINFLWILPSRTAFISIYFIRNFSLKSMIYFLRSVSIILIVGVPFVFINIFLTYVRLGTVDGLWDELSPFKNLKLLIRNGKIVRNMKRGFIESGKIYGEIISNSGVIKQGVLPLSKGIAHAVSFKESSKGGVGVTYTRREQKCDDALVARDGDTFIYVQCFGSNEVIPKNDVKNSNLLYLLNGRGIMDTVFANMHLFKMRNAEVIFNDKNRQFLKKLDLNELNESKKFLDACGGIDKVSEAFEYRENINEILLSARKMLYILSNVDSSSISQKYIKYRETHNILIELEKANHLGYNSELLEIKNKIDAIISGYI